MFPEPLVSTNKSAYGDLRPGECSGRRAIVGAGFHRGFAADLIFRKTGGRGAAVGDESPACQPSPDTKPDLCGPL